MLKWKEFEEREVGHIPEIVLPTKITGHYPHKVSIMSASRCTPNRNGLMIILILWIEIINWKIKRKDMLNWKIRSDSRDNDRNDICGDDSGGNSKWILVVLVDIIFLKKIYILRWK